MIRESIRCNYSSCLEITEIVEVIAQCLIIGTIHLREWTLRSSRDSGSPDRIARDDTSLDVELIVRETRDRVMITIVEYPDRSTASRGIDTAFAHEGSIDLGDVTTDVDIPSYSSIILQGNDRMRRSRIREDDSRIDIDISSYDNE